MSPSSQALPVPSHERFEIVAKLGEGSMGVVYAARDKQREGLVALKVTRSLTSKRIYRFKREFRALAELSHPNVITLYELIASEGQWLLVMELIDGTGLLDHVGAVESEHQRFDASAGEFGLSDTIHASSDPLWAESDSSPSGTLMDESRPVQVHRGGLSTAHRAPGQLPRVTEIVDLDRLREGLVQLAAALCALHRKGVIHRDLKPSNVMVTKAGRVVLMDFGVVAELDLMRARPDSPSTVMGTPAFMAPEQGLGRPPSAAADWYTFGVILYRALTGLMPYCGTPLALLVGKHERSPTPIPALVTGAPDDLVELCARLLSLRPGDRPTGAEVLAALGRGGAAETSSSLLELGDAPFVGRADELASLRQRYASIARGGASFVVVEGVAGIGKTSLARRLVADLQTHEPAPLVLSARCRARESLPYKAIDEAIDDLCLDLDARGPDAWPGLLPDSLPYLARLFPVLARFVSAQTDAESSLSSLAPRELRARAVASLRELVESLGRERPVIINIDDLQWVDDDSVPLLEALFEAPERARLLVLASARCENDETPYSDAVSQLLVALESAGVCHRVRLGPLSIGEQHSLLEALEPGIGAREDSLEALTRDAGGHPLLLSELARAQLVDGESLGVVVELDALLHRRVLELAAPERRMLELLAVGGETLPVFVLGRAAGLDEALRDRSLRTLGVERLVRVAAGIGETRVDVYQDKITEAILAHLEPGALVELTERLALALEDWGEASPANLARLWREAKTYDKAAAYALEAGHNAARALAFAQAQLHYRAALELGSHAELGNQGWDIHCRAWSGLAELARRTGESGQVVREGEALASEARAHASTRELARVHYLLGCLLFPRGELEGCARHHQAALEAAKSCESHELQARALGGLGDMEFMRGRMKTCTAHCRAALELARVHAMPEVEASTLALASSSAFYDGDLRATKRCISKALPIVEALGDRRTKTILLCIGAFRYLQLARLDRAERFVEGMAELVDTLGMAHLRGLVALSRAELAWIAGRRAEAEALALGGLEVAVATGQRFANASLMGMCALTSDHAEARRRWLARGRAQLERTPFAHEHMQFYRLAFDAALAERDWDLVDEFADALEAFIAVEPAGWSAFAIDRARFLAAYGRDPSGPGHDTARAALRERAKAANFHQMLRGL